MGRGELSEATASGSSDLYYVDAGLYDTPEYGSVYILDADRPALVDTGTGYSYEVVLDAMAAVGVDPAELAAICLTHVHLDHAGGASVLARECPNATVFVHESGAQFLRDPTRIWNGTKSVVGDRIEYYREPDPIPADRIHELEDGEAVSLGDHTLDAHRAPGHAFHQVVYHDRTNDGVFTGDAAGINVPAMAGVQPTSPPPDFHLEQCLDDVELLQDLDPAALYYGHFGDRPTGDLLAAFADVIECWVTRVEQKRSELGDDESVVEYFVETTDTTGVWSEAHARGEARMNVEGVLHYLDEQAD
jgi:glyoxylase-like metal-dependent hydrolase (beta-lactamase superfamily II)